MKNMKINDEGFSLVELIVSVLITGILMVAVGMFMSTSRNAYQSVSTSARLQEESMTVERVLSEYIMEAQKYGKDLGETVSGKVVDIYWVKTRPVEGTSSTPKVYFFVYDSNEKTLRYYEGSEGDVDEASGSITAGGINHLATGVFGANAKYSLVASYVDSITEKKIVKKDDGTDFICLELQYSYLDRTYTDNLTVVTRNKTGNIVTPDPDPGEGP